MSWRIESEYQQDQNNGIVPQRLITDEELKAIFLERIDDNYIPKSHKFLVVEARVTCNIQSASNQKIQFTTSKSNLKKLVLCQLNDLEAIYVSREIIMKVKVNITDSNGICEFEVIWFKRFRNPK